MGIKGREEVTACEGGIGCQVAQGRNRVDELQKHAELLRERLALLESMLPVDKIVDDHPYPEENLEMDEERDSQACILKRISDKERWLRDQIYSMNCTEESYRNVLTRKQDRPEVSGETSVEARSSSKLSSKASNIAERISKLEACSRQLCSNLRKPRKNRCDLSREAEMLTRELELARRKLGLDRKGGCSANCPEGHPGNVQRVSNFRDKCVRGECEKSPECRKREPRRSSPRKEPPPAECPCGTIAKCDSCVICSCDDWEKDLEKAAQTESRKSMTDEEKGDKEEFEEEEENSVITDMSKTESTYQRDFREFCSCGFTGSGRSFPPNLEATSDASLGTCTAENVDTETEVESCCECGLSRARNFQLFQQDRCRGGVDVSEDARSGCSTTCTCSCRMCTLTNGKGKGSSCAGVHEDPSDRTVLEDDLETIYTAVDVPPEIDKLCEEGKLREGLEHLKNQNHALKKILSECVCSRKEARVSRACSSSLNPVDRHKTDAEILALKENTSQLMAAVKILQNKCRTKDGMIAVLANELKRAGNKDQRERILRSMADPEVRKRAVDFDRVTLWKYLEGGGTSPRPTVSRQSENTCKKDLVFGVLVLVLVILSSLPRLDARLIPVGVNLLRVFLLHGRAFSRSFLPSCSAILENGYHLLARVYQTACPPLVFCVSTLRLCPRLALSGCIILNCFLLFLADERWVMVMASGKTNNPLARRLESTFGSCGKPIVFSILLLCLGCGSSFLVFDVATNSFLVALLSSSLLPAIFFLLVRHVPRDSRLPFEPSPRKALLRLSELPSIYLVYASCLLLGYLAAKISPFKV